MRNMRIVPCAVVLAGVFSLGAPQCEVASIRVKNPAGGEDWEVGSVQTITWDSRLVERVIIEISRDGGYWRQIAGPLSADDDQCDWTVTAPPAGSCLIKVSALNPWVRRAGGMDVSGTFAIWSITISSPTAGDEWTVGATQAIQWTYEPYQGEVVQIEVSRDGGSNWELIADNVPADAGSYSWDVTAPVSSDCQVRVSSQDEHYRERVSEVFSILPIIVRVDDDNTTAPWDGTTWATAYKHPQDALDDLPDPCPGVEIWVAEGTYTRRNSVEETVVTMKDGVSLYGGFAGTETSRSQRIPRVYTTSLDGQDVCQHVVWGAPDAVFDGFVVKRGHALGHMHGDVGGGGLYHDAPGVGEHRPLRVGDCVFQENYAEWCGGAIFAWNVAVQIEGCTFARNETGRCCGGAVYLWCNLPTGHPDRPIPSTVSNCYFGDGLSPSGGGLCLHMISPEVWNCIFYFNEAVDYYGGGICCWESSPTITNCTIFLNRAAQYGGAICLLDNSEATMANCILWMNYPLDYPEIHTDSTSLATVTYSDVRGGYAGDGNIDANPLLIWAPNGELHLGSGSPCIDVANGDEAPEYDCYGRERHDDLGTPNGDVGDPEYADMGVCEFQGTTPAPPDWYVDIDALAAGDGLSWATAFQHPQDAVDVAVAGQRIWVAKGTYVRRGSDEVVLEITESVEVYGGFAGDEICLLQRDVPRHYTVLTGEDSYSVVFLQGCAAVFDGFFVVRGSAASGAGMEARDAGGAKILNCTFAANTAFTAGALEVERGQVDVTSCRFYDNVALTDHGGAIRNTLGDLTLSDCMFHNNSAPGLLESGGAVYCGALEPGATTLTVDNCRFQYNSAGFEGGAIYCLNCDVVTIEGDPVSGDSVFLGNSSTYAAALDVDSNTFVLSGYTFRDNRGQAGVESCAGLCTVEDCVFEEHSGHGIYCTYNSLNVRKCEFTSNDGAGVYLYKNLNALVEDCTFRDNESSGIYSFEADTIEISRCVFTDNYSYTAGGALWFVAVPDATVVNCLFVANSAGSGGAVFHSGVSGDELTVVNCTFYDNTAPWGCAIQGAKELAVINCIVWYSHPVWLRMLLDNTCYQQIVVDPDGDCSIEYCNIRVPGGSALDTPGFVDPANRDFHLQKPSRCIDGGTWILDVVPNDDLDGNERPQGLGYDMGAYEYAPE